MSTNNTNIGDYSNDSSYYKKKYEKYNAKATKLLKDILKLDVVNELNRSNNSNDSSEPNKILLANRTEKKEFNNMESSVNSLYFLTNSLAQNRISSWLQPIKMNRFFIICDKNTTGRNFLRFNCYAILFLEKNKEENIEICNNITTILKRRNEGRPTNIDDKIKTLNDNTINRWLRLGQINGEIYKEDGRIHILRFDAGHLPRGGGNEMLCLLMKYVASLLNGNISQIDLATHEFGNEQAYKNMGFVNFDGSALTHNPNYKIDINNFNLFYDKCHNLDINRNLSDIQYYISDDK